MKSILVLFISLVSATIAVGQVISYDDFTSIIPLIEKEDFKGTFEATEKLLNSTQNHSSDLRGIITYMNIYSAAGMVTVDKMTPDALSKNIDKYVGQYIVMSAHPCIDSSNQGFNALTFSHKDGEIQGFVTSSNNAKTNILCFEYFKYSNPINPSEFIGKNVRCGGILSTFEVNSRKSKIWICRLQVTDAFARVMESR